MNPPERKVKQLLKKFDFLTEEEAYKVSVIFATEVLKMALTEKSRDYWNEILTILKSNEFKR